MLLWEFCLWRHASEKRKFMQFNNPSNKNNPFTDVRVKLKLIFFIPQSKTYVKIYILPHFLLEITAYNLLSLFLFL